MSEMVVAVVRESRGPKYGNLAALGHPEWLRMGAVKQEIYQKRGEFGKLRHRAKAYTPLVVGPVRVRNRVKSLFRSRGGGVAGKVSFGYQTGGAVKEATCCGVSPRRALPSGKTSRAETVTASLNPGGRNEAAREALREAGLG